MYFSVTNAIRIGKKVYTPCVCYKLTDSLEATVVKLKEEGKAETYNDPVFFQTGERITAKKKTTSKKTKKQPAYIVSSKNTETEEVTGEE